MDEFKLQNKPNIIYHIDGITPSTVYYSNTITGVSYTMSYDKFQRLKDTNALEILD